MKKQLPLRGVAGALGFSCIMLTFMTNREGGLVGHKKENHALRAGETLGRANVGDRYAQKRKKRSLMSGAKIAALIICAIVLVAGVGVGVYFANIQSRLNEGVDDSLLNSLTETSADDPFYMLLLGVDKSEERTSYYGSSDSAYRADSMILARIDPQEKQVTLVSLHRDTLMDFGENGKQKLNAAYALGGPSYVVEVVSQMAGVPISHYAEIDFDEFVSVVNTLGGIEVDVPMEIDDDMAGGHVDAGLQTLNGEQALILCRARHAYDDYGDGDLYRAANQRMVISAIIKKILSSDVATMTASIDTCANAVTTDMSLSDILSLAMQMRGLDTENNIYTGMEPTTATYTNSTWYEILDTSAWKTMMERVDKGLSPYSSASEDPTNGLAGGTVNTKNDDGTSSSSSSSSTSNSTTISTDYSGAVTVLNGTSVSGLASRIATTLDNAGFTCTTGNASGSYTSTLIIYTGSSYEARAEAVNQALGGSYDVIENTGQYSVSDPVTVVLGTDIANS